ncbi:unnamed protein product [Lymnaea stagnalis]|uniref:Membrane-associated protein n=1 Tax=Lymnaea stagnalis TaxID=6523 RepID=A0AAV2I490_LYMST
MDLKNLQKIWLIAALVVSVCIIIRQHYLLAATSQHALPLPPSLVVNIAPLVGAEKNLQGNESSKLFTSLRWVVMDAAVTGCRDVTAYEKQHDWGVIIVTNVPQETLGCRAPKCLQLTSATVTTDLRHFETSHLLGHPHLLSGYLWAVTRGATSILRVDCPSLPLADITRTLRRADEHPSGLWYNSSTVFIASQYWAQPMTLDKIDGRKSTEVKGDQSKYPTSDMFHLGDLRDVSIRHVVCVPNAKQTPNPESDKRGNLAPVVVGPDVIAPLPVGPTLFLKNSFYYMFKPLDADDSQLKLFEALWVHELKRLRLVNVAFYPSTAPRSENSDLCFSNAKDDTLGVVKLRTMVECVQAGECEHASDAQECVVQKAQTVLGCLNFHPSSIAKNVELLKAWLRDLHSLRLPTIRPQPVPVKNAFKIKYRVGASFSGHLTQLSQMATRISQSMSEVCSDHFKPRLNFLDAMLHPVMDDVLLIVVINYESLFRNVPYTEFMHRPYFKHILYCGPSADHFASFAGDLGLTYVSYVEGLTHGWYLMYECVTHGMKLGLPVKGYLQIGEDVLLNTWKLVGLPRDRIWMPAGFTRRKLHDTRRVHNWVHWNSPMGQRAAIQVFSEIRNASGDTSLGNHTRGFRGFAKRFLANYEHNIGLGSIIHRATDIFYVPDVLRDDYITASELFRRHGSMIEIALPVIHYGLARKEEVVYMSGSSLWGKDRTSPWTHYDPARQFFIHPFKLLRHTSQLDGRRFFCQTFLPRHERGLMHQSAFNTTNSLKNS